MPNASHLIFAMVCRARKQQQLGSVSAATAAAHADADAASATLKSSSRGREAARLAAENKALLDMLSQAADGRAELQEKLDAIRSRYASQVCSFSILSGKPRHRPKNGGSLHGEL
jgi:hypothetical protein